MGRLTQSVVSLLFQGVSLITRRVQGLIEENLLAFPPRDSVFLPILVTISAIPVKSREVLKQSHCRLPEMYMLNIYTLCRMSSAKAITRTLRVMMAFISLPPYIVGTAGFIFIDCCGETSLTDLARRTRFEQEAGIDCESLTLKPFVGIFLVVRRNIDR